MDEPVGPPRAAGWYRDPPGGKEYGYWDGSAWRPDVTAALNRMREPATFFTRRRALARIGEFVSNDETVECIAAGTYYSWGNHRVAVVLTDRRLLLLIGSRRRAGVREFPLESISFVESGSGGIAVFAKGEKLSINDIYPGDAAEIAYAIRRHIGQASNAPQSWKRWLPQRRRR